MSLSLMDWGGQGVVRLKLLPVARVRALVPRDATLSRAALLFLTTIRKTAEALRSSGVV